MIAAVIKAEGRSQANGFTNLVVPFVVVVMEERQNPYKLPAIARHKVLSETPQQLRLEGLRNRPKDSVYCLPGGAAWASIQQLHSSFQQALDSLANYLRALGHYPNKLKQHGGVRKGKYEDQTGLVLVKGKSNPLSPTVIDAYDPDYDRFLELSDWQVYPEQPSRTRIMRHTAQMMWVIGEFNGKEYESPTSQAGHFVCPDDAAWERYVELHDLATAASQALQACLKNLGTYAAASIDGRYHHHSTTAQAETVSESSPDVERVLESHEPEVVSAFKVGDRVLIHQEGHPDLHGRISRFNSDGETVVFIDEFDAATTVSIQYLFPAVVTVNDGEIAPTHPSSLISHPPDPLSDLATQINELHSQGCEAEETAIAAGKAALQLRKEEGDRLLEAKAQVKHGRWGKWLKANCPGISERSCQLYMQLAEGWEEYIAKNETVAELTLREAIALLPKRTKNAEPASTPSALDYTPLPEPKPAWFKVGENWTEGQAIATNQRGTIRIIWGEDRECDVPGDRVKWSKPLELLRVEDVLLYELEQELSAQIAPEARAGLTAEGLSICTPSITPTEFNREMWGDKPPAVSYTPTVSPPVACQLCQHRTPIDGVEQDRYWCEMGEFDDTLPIKCDWAKEGNEGACKSFEVGKLPPQQPAASPEPEAPTVRLKVKRGKGKSVEVVSAIVQIGGVTHYLQLEDLTLEDI